MSDEKLIVTKSKLDSLATSISIKSGIQVPMTIAQMKTAVDGIGMVTQDENGYIILPNVGEEDNRVSVNDIANAIIGEDITITVPTVKAYAFYGTDIENVTLDGVTSVNSYSFAQCKNLKTLTATNTNGFDFVSFNFQGCNNLETLIVPYNVNIGERCFDGCSKLGPYFVHNCFGIWTGTLNGCASLIGIDLGEAFNNTRATMCAGCTNLTSFIIRRTGNIVSLANISAFNNTPFASDGTGGTLYVPADLLDSYQSATNWSTILQYENNSIKSIESTHTDPNAPVDLTTHFIDGTPLPTRTRVLFTRMDGRNYNTSGTYGSNTSYFSTDFIDTDGVGWWEFISGFTYNSNNIRAQAFNDDTFIGMATSHDCGNTVIDDVTLNRVKFVLPYGTTKFRFCAYPKTSVGETYYLYKVIEA